MTKADFDIDWNTYAVLRCGRDGMPNKAFVISGDVLSHPGCVAFFNDKSPCVVFPNEKGIATQVNIRAVRVTRDDLRICVDEDGVEFFVVLIDKRRAIIVLTEENGLRFGRFRTIGGLTFLDVDDVEPAGD